MSGEDFALARREGVERRSHGTRIVAPGEGRRTTRKVGEANRRRLTDGQRGVVSFCHAGGFELPAVECLPGGLDIQPVRERPVRERGNRYENGAAEVGERVLYLRRHRGVDGTLHQAVSLELP